MRRAIPPLAIWFSVALILVEGLCSMKLFAEQPSSTQAAFVPDPATVTRYGPGWRFPQDGWIVTHIEGTPYERGYQHGSLLAREIADYCHTLAKVRSHLAPDKAWHDLRVFVNALFLRRIDQEFLKEMQGIADGAATAGAKIDGRPLDLIDIVVINTDIEVGYLESSLDATPTGIDRIRFRGRHASSPRGIHRDRCSAFIATGPATADGKIVAGHVTMTDLYNSRYFNVWLDIQPSTGNRIVFQTYPGGIQSGLDYYITGAGLILTETTIEQTRFNPLGETLASRVRRVAQYADSIERCAEILTSSNNGLYTNEWLIGDIKTNEIAMFELGTDRTKIWRSSRNEWFAGTKGFYWGCNNVKDLDVFKETVADFGAKPENIILRPQLRDVAWMKLFNQRQGKIDASFGFEAFSTPPIIAFSSCDAKLTTAAMAKDLKSWGLFGPPNGRTWTPSENDREDLPTIQPLVSHDWTMLDVQSINLLPTKLKTASPRLAVDQEMFPKKEESLAVDFDDNHPFAWRGTLLPRTDADIWLAAAFSDLEKIVSLEHAIERYDQDADPQSGESMSAKDDDDDDECSSNSSKDDSGREGKDLVDLALFQYESKWLTAVRRVGRDVPLTETATDQSQIDWYRIAAGKGVMLLSAIRKQMGAEPFKNCLDEFGQAHAGQTVSTDQFRTHLMKAAGPKTVAILDRWLTEDMSGEFKSKNPWTIFSHEVEPDRVIIVYGTLRDRAANKEAAEHLQLQIARRFANVFSPIKSDQEVSADDLASNHLLLVGRPITNRVSARCLEKSSAFPVTFGEHSFKIGNETYANAETWTVAAGQSGFSPRYSAVIYAGLNAAATWRSVRNLPESTELSAQVMLSVQGHKTRSFRPR